MYLVHLGSWVFDFDLDLDFDFPSPSAFGSLGTGDADILL